MSEDAAPRAWLINYAVLNPEAADVVLDLVEADKLSDAFWHIAGLHGGIPGASKDQNTALLQMGKEGGRTFVCVEDFVIHAYLQFTRTDRITLAPPLLTQLLAIGTEEQLYGIVDALPPMLRHGRLILVPIFIDSSESPHWLLACIDPRAHEVLYIDSYDCEAADCWGRTTQLAMLCSALEMCDPAWEGAVAAPWGRWHDVPQQSNKTDCGVFVMEFGRLIAKGLRPQQSSRKGADLRRKMTLELVQWWNIVRTVK